MNGDGARAAGFRGAFDAIAGRVRLRQAARQALLGASAGLIVGALAAGVARQTRHGLIRPFFAGFGLLGAAAAVVLGRRRRFTDHEVALFLDARLKSEEVVTTALELPADGDDSARAVILSRAATTLADAAPERTKTAIFRPIHAALPLAAAGLIGLSIAPLPPPPPLATPPGVDTVGLADVSGLEKVAELGALHARDDEQRKRLAGLADEAKKLHDKLKDGMERREAQDEIARLKDEIAAERLSLGDGERRQGLEAALGRLGQDPLTKDAAKALGDRDLVRFDEEMQKLANSREQADRERAKKILEEAAEAARKNGASDVAKALEDQKKLMDERGKRADELRALGQELSKGLSEEQRKDLEDFGSNPTDKNGKKAAQALEDALKKLTPEERKRLAENLKKKMQDQTLSPESRQSLKDLAKDLDSPEGQKKLEEELKKLANEGTDDDEAERQKKLDEAERGLGQGDRGVPMPMPSPGQGAPGSGNDKSDGKDGQPGGEGHHEDTGTGDHKGETPKVEGDDLRSRANAKINKGAPNAGVTIGRGEGRAGDTANAQGTGAIGRAGPGEVSGVERSEVPEEYREQVGRYFTP